MNSRATASVAQVAIDAMRGSPVLGEAMLTSLMIPVRGRTHEGVLTSS
jgi:hypothetical protein